MPDVSSVMGRRFLTSSPVGALGTFGVSPRVRFARTRIPCFCGGTPRHFGCIMGPSGLRGYPVEWFRVHPLTQRAERAPMRPTMLSCFGRMEATGPAREVSRELLRLDSQAANVVPGRHSCKPGMRCAGHRLDCPGWCFDERRSRHRVLWGLGFALIQVPGLQQPPEV